MRIFKQFLIYLFLIVYSVEILLFVFTTDQQKSMVDIKNTRIEIAKKKNIKYDTRTPEEFFFDSKKKHEDLEPKFYYSSLFGTLNSFIEAKKNKTLIPFRGPINSKSISCAEDLMYRLIENDKYGFKNPNSIYEKPINSMLLGDSYAEGFCVVRKEDIAGNLDSKGFPTVNLGVAATGPLISLAIMREFGNFIKPKNSIYLYFEGNDLEGLNWEKNDSNLIQYLNDEYNVDYINRYDSIRDFLILSSKESISIAKSKLKLREAKKSKLEIFKQHISDIAEIQNLKNIFRYKIFNKERSQYDLDLFFLVIEKMNMEVKKWDGNYIFVYVPSWSRYFTKNTKKEASIKLKEKILNKLKSKQIKVIDLSEFFAEVENIEQYFPLGYLGHYNATGYKKISEIIANELKP